MPNPLTVPAIERPCPNCGGERTCIGHEITEVIKLIPAEVVVRRDIVEKLRRKPCDGELVRAEAGDKVVAGGKLGPGLVAQLLVDKYDDGLPLHGQKQRFARMGLELAVSTMADQVTWSTDLLRPLWRAALAEVLAAKAMHLDATGLPVLDREEATGKRIGALWGYVGDTNVAAYIYTSTGKKEGQRPGELGPQDMLLLLLHQGYTVADASNLFDESFKRTELIECGCNMHARRILSVTGAGSSSIGVTSERVHDGPVLRAATVLKLDLPSVLRSFCWTTNAMEKRWRSPRMAKGWTAVTIARARQSFRRIKGHKYLPVLVARLESLRSQLDAQKQTS